MMTDPYDILRVSLLPRVGPARGRTLLNAFPAFDDLCRATRLDLLRLDGIQQTLADAILTALRDRVRLSEAERIVERSRMLAERNGIRLVTFQDPEYPAHLHRIWDPPLYLFIKGRIPDTDERHVAIVGTRAPTDYGKRVAERLVRALAEVAATIVSGLALGIDTIAHKTALAAGADTVAALGSGVCRIYPTANHALADAIAEQGCVLSELPLDAKPDAVNFPRRNRIISALSAGVVVVESAETGGAMLTAGFALDHGKEVFAVPGSIFSTKSDGPHRLIRNGTAHCCRSVDDIVSELSGFTSSETRTPAVPVQTTLEEQRVLDALGRDPVHIDALALQLDLPPQQALVELLGLEFKGLVRQLPGKHFARVR